MKTKTKTAKILIIDPTKRTVTEDWLPLHPEEGVGPQIATKDTRRILKCTGVDAFSMRPWGYGNTRCFGDGNGLPDEGVAGDFFQLGDPTKCHPIPGISFLIDHDAPTDGFSDVTPSVADIERMITWSRRVVRDMPVTVMDTEDGMGVVVGLTAPIVETE